MIASAAVAPFRASRVCAMRVAGASFLSIAAILTASCGGGDNTAPVATAAAHQAIEDVELTATLAGTDADGDRLRFRIGSGPWNGTATVDEASGTFTYRGAADFHGNDEFEFFVVDGNGATSAPARISVAVSPVNDAPRIAPIADSRNSPESFEVSIRYVVQDPEGDAISVSVDVDDSSIATAIVDETANEVRIQPHQQGRTIVSLEASDAELTSATSFSFLVGQVTKIRDLAGGDAYSSAIEILNEGPRDAYFQLRHNEASLAVSLVELLDEALASQTGDARTTAQRLWGFVNNNTYHWYSLSGSRWVHDPLIMFNSIGFGLCDDAASALVLLARAAGLEAHVWALEGHIVAELGQEQMRGVYDADLSVFYHDDFGAVAGVTALTADTTLITSPRSPVLPGALGQFAYSSALAAIYGSVSDNLIHDWYVESAPPNPGLLRLPPGASLKYPGVWTGSPRSTGGDGANAPVFANMMMTLPAGWTGALEMPLVLKAIRGEGRVRVGTGEYEISSTALDISLDVTPNRIPDIEIIRSNTPIELVYLLNPLRFGTADDVNLALTGMETWALRVSLIELPEANRRSGQPTESFRKPFF
jgi:hypothetical protein